MLTLIAFLFETDDYPLFKIYYIIFITVYVVINLIRPCISIFEGVKEQVYSVYYSYHIKKITSKRRVFTTC